MAVERDIDVLLDGLVRPDDLQEDCLLNRIVRPNARCEYGREHRFEEIRTVSDYQRNVPIVTYSDIERQIARMADGEPGVLTTEPVRRFFATSGSTGAAKLVPVTSSLIADKARAFGVYWGLLFQSHPDADSGKVVGNFSDSAGGGKVASGLPLTSEGAYWNAVGAATQKRGRSPLPRSVSQIADSDSRYYTVARILLEEEVSLLMALNPSTLLLLFRKLNAYVEDLIRDVERGGLRSDLAVSAEVRDHIAARYAGNPARASQLRKLMRSTDPVLAAHEVWPTLKLVVSWRSPMQQPYLRLLEPHLASIPQRDYILMASEGVIAIPTEDRTSGGVLATPFHFYEFIPEEDVGSSSPRVLLASELEVGKSYVVLLSTTAGLYRYNIGDVLRVTGMKERTPVVEFLHRSGSTCSITGEKLTEEQVVQAMNAVVPRFGLAVEGFTLHPALDGFPHYTLLLEPSGSPTVQELRALLRAFDVELAERNIEYSAKRRSERLGPPELWVAKKGSYDARRRSRIAAGANDAQIKPIHLTRNANFSADFQVSERVTGA
ncbi:GH3 auxin-responsive promoter family protein [Sorangium sp. So ce1335]|uniref:GH3 auxin-responsive promoter family protein n=1 Tax=Sorangium sp. So ce1335 TaxID=3133335 RepID=UPI003F648A2D